MRRATEYRKMGLDLAFDKSGKLWMIEGNTWPQVGFFSRLKDQSTYRKIKQMTAAYLIRRRCIRLKTESRHAVRCTPLQSPSF